MKSVFTRLLSSGVADRLQLAMRTAGTVLAVVILLTVSAVAQDNLIVKPGQLVWKPLSPDVEMAVVSGNPDKKGGLYVIRIRSKGEVKVPPHWHPTDEHITVLAGSILIARGDTYDASKLIELEPGAHALMSARRTHFALHKAGNVVEVYGEGPFTPHFVNAEDDSKRTRINERAALPGGLRHYVSVEMAMSEPA